MLALLSCASVAQAAGLGKLNVLSRLGQPFAAEIDLINVAGDDLASLRVSLAPPAAYQAANLRFDPALNALRLSVERRANGAPYVRATSLRSVTEPYLDLLVEVNSQAGKLQRAYAALLDLPEASPLATAAAPPVAATPVAKADVMPPRVSQTPRAAVVAAPTSKSMPVTPAPLSPPPRAPAPSAATSNTVVAALESRPVAPAKPESPKAVAAPPSAAVAETPKVEPSKSESPEPATAPALEPPKSATNEAAVPRPPINATSAEPSFFATLKHYLAPSFAPSFVSYAVPIGAVGLALLAGIGGLWAVSASRRRKQAPLGVNEPIAPNVDPIHPHAPATPLRRVPPAVPAALAVSAATEPVRPVAAVSEAAGASVNDTVDPIDEAKVYIAYGQSEPAEKILRAALSNEPGREDIPMLLLEVLSGRGDKDGFNQLARRLHRQTGGLGANWKRAMAMGYALDPTYPLYLPDEATAPSRTRNTAPATAAPGNLIDIPLPRDAQGDDSALDFEKTMVLVKSDLRPEEPGPSAAVPAKPLPDITFDFPAASAPTPTAEAASAIATAVTQGDAGLDIEVDFSSMTLKPLDVPVETKEPAAALATAASDARWEEVQQKIELARAYREMGDKAGALDLLREAEAEGDDGQQAEVRQLLQLLQ